jgi:hypothetical protein
VTGSLTGAFTGSLTGSFTGSLTGPFTGVLPGSLTGSQGGWLLPVLVALPLVTALVLLGLRRLSDDAATRIAAAIAAITFAVAGLAALAAAPYDRDAPGLVIDRVWIPALGVHAHLAMDGVSAPLVLLTALLGLLVTLHAVRIRPVGGRRAGHLHRDGPAAVLRRVRGRPGADVVHRRAVG